MLLRYGLLMVLSLGIALPAAADKRPYGIDDLRALAKGARWAELLEHIEDVPPAKRDASWRKLLHRAATGWLSGPALRATPLRAVRIAEALLRRHPGLAKDKKLMAMRNKVGIAAFRRCFTEGRWRAQCEQRLRSFIAQEGSDGATAYLAAKLVRRHMPHHMAVRYFRQAVTGNRVGSSKDLARRCGDSALAQATLAALTRGPSSKMVIADAKSIAFGPCWAHLRAKLVDAVATNDRARQNLCKGLLARRVLKGVRRKKCQRVKR